MHQRDRNLKDEGTPSKSRSQKNLPTLEYRFSNTHGWISKHLLLAFHLCTKGTETSKKKALIAEWLETDKKASKDMDKYFKVI
jgi:hypothetical protein